MIWDRIAFDSLPLLVFIVVLPTWIAVFQVLDHGLTWIFGCLTFEQEVRAKLKVSPSPISRIFLGYVTGNWGDIKTGFRVTSTLARILLSLSVAPVLALPLMSLAVTVWDLARLLATAHGSASIPK